MARINLRDYYPFYHCDCYIDVRDDLVDALQKMQQEESAYQRRLYRNKAYYSLNRNDGIENGIIPVCSSSQALYENMDEKKQLHAAMSSLSEKQAKRIYACFFLKMSKTDIAAAEHVSKAAVSASIERGLRALEKKLKEFAG